LKLGRKLADQRILPRFGQASQVNAVLHGNESGRPSPRKELFSSPSPRLTQREPPPGEQLQDHHD
jgi:hypothetical protein